MLVEKVKALYASVRDPVHGFDHVLRVERLAEFIASEEGGDLEIVRAAALLHDIGTVLGGRDDHHNRSALEAKRILIEEEGWPESRAEAVVHAIRAHRFRDRSVQPETLEAKILYDADKLDAIGAIGVARSFAYLGMHGGVLWNTSPFEVSPEEPPPGPEEYTPAHEFAYKLARIKDTLYTETARRIAERRHRFMVEFFRHLEAEVELKE